MPDLKDVVAVVVAGYLACALTGHIGLFYKALAYVHYTAVSGLNADWGCPVSFNGACGHHAHHTDIHHKASR